MLIAKCFTYLLFGKLLPIIAQNLPNLLSDKQNRLLSGHTSVFAIEVVDISKRNVGGIGLVEADVGATRNSRWEMEGQVPLSAFLVSTECSEQK